MFCIFVPTRYMWIYYSFMVLLRLYLAGLAFSWLCFYTKRNCSRYAVLAGAVIYAFCFWGLWNANRHPYFLNPMVYFPLIILGVEKILKKEKPYILIVSVFLASISNFYFFYILAVLTVIYVLIRLILIYKKDIRNIFMTLLRIGLPAILGTLMGAVIVLPVLIFFLNDIF